ncbi:hypothetical protein E4T42_07709 [Aureobasidium subglaciale]|nr:hypothetical protein E4T42_07709 [Aureobasidium subglaciale]
MLFAQITTAPASHQPRQIHPQPRRSGPPMVTAPAGLQGPMKQEPRPRYLPELPIMRGAPVIPVKPKEEPEEEFKAEIKEESHEENARAPAKRAASPDGPEAPEPKRRDLHTKLVYRSKDQTQIELDFGTFFTFEDDTV